MPLFKTKFCVSLLQPRQCVAINRLAVVTVVRTVQERVCVGVLDYGWKTYARVPVKSFSGRHMVPTVLTGVPGLGLACIFYIVCMYVMSIQRKGGDLNIFEDDTENT